MTRPANDGSAMTAPQTTADPESRSRRLVADAGAPESARPEEQPGAAAAKAGLREVMGCFATGAAIITAVLDGKPYGLAVNSFTSVSLDPPMVLFCVDRSAASCDAFTAARGFAVHILGHEQQESRRCSRLARRRSSSGSSAGGAPAGRRCCPSAPHGWTARPSSASRSATTS